MKKILKYIQIIGGLIAFGPILISLLEFPLSFIFNCVSMPGTVGTCGIGGRSMSEFVRSLPVMSVFVIFTFIPGMVIFFVASIFALFIKNREKKLMAKTEFVSGGEQIPASNKS
jgi:hypothetical protein